MYSGHTNLTESLNLSDNINSSNIDEQVLQNSNMIGFRLATLNVRTLGGEGQVTECDEIEKL